MHTMIRFAFSYSFCQWHEGLNDIAYVPTSRTPPIIYACMHMPSVIMTSLARLQRRLWLPGVGCSGGCNCQCSMNHHRLDSLLALLEARPSN